MIEVKNLVKDYGKHHAVKDISFSVPDGQIVGLLGPNGSGKTTTINCILALLAFDKGTVRVFGREMRPDSYDLKRQIGVVMQNVAVFQELTVYENIDYFCGLYVPDKRKRKELVEEAITFTDLNDYRKMRPKKLSGGLLRRLNIACGIAHKPRLIIMDEPTVGVDAQSRDLIMDSIKSLNQAGSSIIYTSHYMHEVEELCDEIGIVNKGQMIARGTYEELATEYADGNCFCVDTSKEALQFHMQEIMGKYVDLHVSVDENTLKFLVQGENHINRILQDMISMNMPVSVSYTHLTLPTNSLV